MNFDESLPSILEEDAWTSSNCLEENKVDCAIDISDFLKKRCDFTIDIPNSELEVVLQAEAEKENECVVETADFIMDGNISNNNTSASNTPIWIMVNKKARVNGKVQSVGTQILGSSKLEATDAVSHLSDKFDLTTNNELIQLKPFDDIFMHNNISNTRNLPNILRGPKILSKSNMSSPIPFEIEENFLGINSALESDISEEEKNKNTKKYHRKRKQIHNPLVIREDTMDSAVNKKLNYFDKSMGKNKLDSKKTEKFAINNRKESNCKEKPLIYKKIGNEISFSPTPMEEATAQNSSIIANVTTYIPEQTEDPMNGLNLSSEFDEFYKEQFHEDYTDHIDILADALRGYQDLNESYDHEFYDMNSNYIFNSNDMECSKLQYKESQDYDGREQNEYPWVDTSIIESNYLSDYEDYLNRNNNFLTSAKDLESEYASSSDYNLEQVSIQNLYNTNCLSSFLNDSSYDEFCLKNLSCNDLQNSFNKDETRNLDTLLLEEKKCETNLENHLNNDLNSSKINFKLINDTKNTIPTSLSNGVGHSTTISKNETEQRNDQRDVLLNADLSANISSDYLEYTELNNINLTEENQLLIQNNIQEEAEVFYNYTVELNYEKRGGMHPLQRESNEIVVTDEDLNKINKPKIVIETLQCVLCALTFTSKRSLALHLAGAHGGMYVILCERCGRLFNKKCLFNRHFIHCGCVKLPFGCQQCNRTYRHKSSLLHHLKTVHRIEHKRDTTKLYKCDICSKVYRKYGAFEKHLGMHINS